MLYQEVKTNFYRVVLILGLCVFQQNSFAGFLDLPKITETPTLERKTYLEDMDIPSVRERNPDPQAGPRLAVKEFRLQGIVEFPELGITREAIGKLVEKIRFDMMAEDKLLESGYTLEELGELSDLLVQIEEETPDRHAGPLEVQRLVWLIREQRAKRGITLGMIETIADKITNFYRERGFILAKAYIPKQEVRKGVVTLTLLLGIMGEADVKNNALYSAESIRSVFDDTLTLPVTNSVIDEKLYLINDFPGLYVTGFFEPGSQVGDTKLNINVVSEKRYDFNIRLDNHGTNETGKNRLYAEALINNTLGYADLLHLGVLRTASPSNSTYWQVKYSANVFSPRFRVGLGSSRNEFVLGAGNSEAISSLDLKGATNQSDITLTYKLERSRASTQSIDLVSHRIESTLRVGALDASGDIGLDDEIENTSLTYNYDILEEKNRRLHQGFLKYTNGKFIKGAADNQKENYNILLADYVFLTFWKIPFFGSETRVIARSSLQYSGQSLSSISQFALAGPTRSRGFPVNKFFADDGVHIGVDWIFKAPDFFDVSIGNSNLKKILQPFLFADFAYGKTYSLDITKGDSSATLANIGFGFKFSYGGNLNSNLQFAFPVQSDFSPADLKTPDDNMKVVFEIDYRF